jgi:hypothetical protein
VKIELGGYEPDQFDQLWVFGSAALDGTLEVTMLNGFVPTNGSSFKILTASSLSGGFTNVQPGERLITSDNAGSFLVTVTGTSVVLEDFRVYTPYEQWRMGVFGNLNTALGDPTADPDGDGMSNEQEFLAGTNPTNAASVLQVLGTIRQGDDFLITWKAVGGKTNLIEAGDSLSSTNHFQTISGPLVFPDSGDVITNFLDIGAATNGGIRFYRVRVLP